MSILKTVKSFRKTFVGILFFTLAFSTFAQENVIVVSGAKVEETIDDSVEKVQVISSEEIVESGAKTLTEAVKNLPGVVVTGANAGNPVDSISMQGFDSAYVKILVDGVAVSGDIAGSVSVFQIPVEDIDHIEVVQGATSALYGSDAMGGVINIITKKTKTSEKTKFSGSLKQEVSTNFRSYTGLGANFASGGFTSSLTGSFDYSAGKRDTLNDPFTGGGQIFYLTPNKRLGFLRGKANYEFDIGSIGINGSFADSVQKSNYTAAGFDQSSIMEYDSKRIEGGLTGEYFLGDTMILSAFTSAKYFTLKTDYPKLTVSSDSTFSAKSDIQDTDSFDEESEIRLTWDPNLTNSVLFGINANYQSIKGDSFSGTKNQLILSAYGQDTISLFNETLAIVPGLRFDYAPSIGGSSTLAYFTPKLSAKWDATETFSFRVSYGMGYRVPTLKQKYWIFYHNFSTGDGNFILTGNTDLDPEKSQSANIGLDFKPSKMANISASGYFNYITDLIDSVVTDSNSNPQKRTYKNIDKAITYGGDINLSGKIDRFDYKLGYAYTAAVQKNGTKWQDLTLRVPHRITGSFGYQIPIIEARSYINAEWNAPRLLNYELDTYSPDYLMLTAGFSKKLMKDKLELYVRADNLLNNIHFKKATDEKDQKEYFGLNDGTIFSLGVQFKF